MEASGDGDPLVRLLDWACTAPSEALMRWCELQLLADRPVARPVLEIGCGNGRFAALTVGRVEQAVDVDPTNVVRARALPGVYGRVEHVDVRDFPVVPGAVGTVFANSVLSVLPDVDRVLDLAHRHLRPGGSLLATVQLPATYRSLALGGRRYRDLRYRQQGIVNLRSEAEWRAALGRAGFTDVDTVGYVPSSLGRFWDMIDGPASIGVGRYRLATAVRLLLRLLPAALRARYHRWWAGVLRAGVRAHVDGEPCHLLIVARR